MTHLVIAKSVFLVIVIVLLPLLALWLGPKSGSAPAKGLNLPEGSVRSMLALMTVGSLIIVVAFGASALGDSYEHTITVLSALAGPVLGFYFGSRGADRGNRGDSMQDSPVNPEASDPSQ